ncbi:RIP metalloprotease RseP [Candidatus Peregrinibacteria bacterium]|jgi:RIP metalloprotease RseP|nr:RIP metalloprotease RseP [Candidatus Peregrinibacteria bacterium]MBT4148516.1 RIP metalloprotease RseP [Candidatus Peregrinibacteria bacterium]MBT4366703.1 RIP metalloprotease RseP [Candidatus Peregrinibacteria bacterium]MBT4455528.1 RIP metalloprotease RseP [Candidatus Peregrinibacteria bacterium]
MNIILTIVLFILVFSVLVLAHEFGHYIVAKRNGIKVEEFGIGLPPKIWGKKKGDTLYSINWIPFGGFVRLYGMDSGKKSRSKSLKNFNNRSMRVRAKVMVAGVVMNLFLAWLFLSIGFTFGMEPLLGPNDVYDAVDDGIVILNEGIYINEVKEGSHAETMGFDEGDAIVRFNGNELLAPEQIEEFLADPVGQYVVSRDGELFWTSLEEENYVDGELGAEVSNMFFFPRVKIHQVDFLSNSYKAGLRDGDVIISVNDSEIYSLTQFRETVEGLDEAYFTVYRDGLRQEILLELDTTKKVIISSVIADTPAYEAGLVEGDILLSVNGKYINNAVDFVSYVTEHQEDSLGFAISRNGETFFTEMTPDEGKIGVYLSELYAGKYNDFSVYNVDQFTSVVEIVKEQHPFYVAPFHALSETWRMTKMTASFFVDFAKGFAQSFEVPDSVTGPVGIAKMTSVFAQEGIIPLIRFVALLSISLAVLNILPFPALDGGKLLFILIEFVLGRKVPYKWENYIHFFGFLIVIALILVVTYQDILRWVN